MDQVRPPLEPSCAICGAPPYPECPHEGESLQRALQQAQDRWMGVQRIRDWVLDNSRNHIIRMFEHLKTVRYNAHLAYLQSLPYYSLYQYHNGRPPLHARELQYLQGQLHNANANLKLGVDQDWRSVCLLYPETLDYYFGLVNLRLPKDGDESVLRPDIGHGRKKIGRRDSGHSDKGGGKKDKGRA
ncbi:hypothetical protein MBLNU13_g02991t1 [Cladosporium sp. NU13]